MFNYQDKITPDHLKRNAYLYIRQSSLKQLVENQESTKRQYALKDRAKALGWHANQIEVIDSDQGKTASGTVEREGFQKLVAEVGMGKAGVVIGLEVSRLARNSTDWHRLLEICALTNTLILDEDGIYNPAQFNDRLLLGLKGNMSEAELHILKARLRGGLLNKALRGELKLRLPAGFIYNDDQVVLDPNRKVQQNIKIFFKIFEQTGSAFLTVREFRKNGLKFPRCIQTGPTKGQLIWVELTHSAALNTLHNPRYAGAFSYGRTRQTRLVNGTYSIKNNPQDKWHSFLPDSHDGYITLDQFYLNRKRLLENAQAFGIDRKKGPPREGPALLQGIVVCGICGERMTIRYQGKDNMYPVYVCQKAGIDRGTKPCQSMAGDAIDSFIGNLLVNMVTPSTLEVAVAIQHQLESQVDETIKLRKQHVEQIQYEVDQARRRYMAVDPHNRLVADSLENEWNQKLKDFKKAQEEYNKKSEQDKQLLDSEQKKKIMTLATDFPKLWKNSNTPVREKKRMIRLLIEDVTLTKTDKITVQIRFKGGTVKTENLPLPVSAFMRRKMPEKIVQEVDKLLDKYFYEEIAEILNNRGETTGEGFTFTNITIRRMRHDYNLKERKVRLLEKGFVPRTKMLETLSVGELTLRSWRKEGLIRVHAYGGARSHIFYEIPSKSAIKKLNKLERNSANSGTQR